MFFHISSVTELWSVSSLAFIEPILKINESGNRSLVVTATVVYD